ncbi:heme NO-binding domain-containing protein [Piscirickettsia litoralis]|uniref:Heme NO-binding domain-containing protein n=1 Tax=Piscirickettsia litoralis TaxID=1891921 RepID=A0ABX3A7W8_9GAMM|nr:heme NO-binding domain-containing protein [Piscirickettsia litoralis]ODN43625.1 hypothetical protein BGC07_12795 [Piscirickettsia litoralis]
MLNYEQVDIINTIDSHLPDIFLKFIEDNFREETLKKMNLNDSLTDYLIGSKSDIDTRMLDIIRDLSKLTGRPFLDMMLLFGEHIFPYLFRHYKKNFGYKGDSFRQFLVHLESLVHKELRSIIPQGDLPKIAFKEIQPHSYSVTYQSPRKLCKVIEGVIVAASKHFSKKGQFSHTPCMLDNNSHCVISIAIESEI